MNSSSPVANEMLTSSSLGAAGNYLYCWNPLGGLSLCCVSENREQQTVPVPASWYQLCLWDAASGGSRRLGTSAKQGLSAGFSAGWHGWSREAEDTAHELPPLSGSNHVKKCPSLICL